jgi:hypothetical protein
MDFRSFNNELALAQIQFMSIFSGIVISRDTKNGSKDIMVPCIAGQRSRILKNLENPELAPRQTLPIIVVERSGFSRDTERLANLNLEQKASPRADMINFNYLSPNPINVSYTVSILTKYPGDLDKILSNFIPFFNGDVYVKIPHPKIQNYSLKCQVLWDGSVQDEWPSEKEPYSDDIQIASTVFTFKTYLFGGQGKTLTLKPDKPLSIGSIFNISFVEFLEKYQITGVVNISKFIQDNPKYFPPEVIDILIKASDEFNLTTTTTDAFGNTITEYFLNMEVAKTLDSDNPQHNYITGSIFVAVPVIFSSCEDYLKMVKSGEISQENADIDRLHIITAESIEGKTSKTSNILII